ncbi:MAG: flagellar export protein FliJ [Lachnospiraceae bacterium]|nr:flagellar export protein FliJ [Lachnospiraceae bacterium]MCH4028487.1 flagellar export protein FliJ [Lachnospiraceae bacterium]MCH4066337.1 flagellar export protein FliJ [Lachnospiraceae bacterium]MCH4112367.1 flagellar export protein FliJ [Lachnospiraceae bacterium]MCI1353346.1 flagellar export protein FliJ [Lachnospiraceae bacterium]
MKKFKYSLQNVLQYKDEILDTEKGEYAARMAAVNQQKKRIEDLVKEQDDLSEEFDEVKRGSTCITDFQIFSGLLDSMERQIEEEQKKLVKLEKHAEEQKKVVIAANVDVKKFVKLKERKLQDYQKAEQKDNEEFVEEFVQHGAAVENQRKRM